MECILRIVTCLCGRLSDGLGGAVQAQAEGGFSSLVSRAGKAILDRVVEWQNKVIPQPTDATTLVGAEENLKTIRSHLLGNEVDVVGIVGMGGVGKTTLLNKINNDFYSGGAGNFNIVIFVTVSREGNALKVQKEIAKRLRLGEQSDSGAISDVLRGKKYLLLLDDVWGELDLSGIGVPFPNRENKCKIALTTRSSDVFASFLGTWCRPRSERARVVDVRKLDPARSWKLFQSMVHHHVHLDDPSIMPHAEKMVKKCDGLPLALITMGRTMATATSPAEWRKAERQLEESPYGLPGMDQVQSNLMFSVDRLKEQGTLLPCFIYCSLFPEDYNIFERDLIEYWIGEGFLDGGDEAPRLRGKGMYGNLQCARDEGEIVIKKLKDLCLLETGIERGCVKMHDLVREVALVLGKWEPNRFVVQAFDSLVAESKPINIVDDEWEKVTRVSLMNGKIQEGSLPEMPCWPRISTLLMKNVFVGLSRGLSDGFFTSMRKLVVLDLSYSLDSPTMPTSICFLSELRFLSLNWTGICSLPMELGNLVKLRQLDLCRTFELEEIPRQAIMGLSNLQVLNMIGCGYEWGLGGENNVGAADNNRDTQLSVSDLDGMHQLKDFRIHIFNTEFLLFNRDSLLTSVTELELSGVYSLSTNILQSALKSMTSLRRFCIYTNEGLTGELILDGPMLSELEELRLERVNLSAILIRRGGPLQKLKRLELLYLPNLQRICDDPRQECLPSLEYLDVLHCPLLRTLPLGPHSKIKEILCEQEWWEKLQWRRDQGDAAARLSWL